MKLPRTGEERVTGAFLLCLRQLRHPPPPGARVAAGA